jgi:hypothetical protein
MRRWVWLVAALLALPATGASGPQVYSTYGEEPAQLLRFDLTTGAQETVGIVGYYRVTGLAFTSDGSLYGIDAVADRLVMVDPSTGAGTLVCSFGVDVGELADLAGGAGGVLWLLDDGSARLYRVDRATGALTLDCQADPAAAAEGLVSRDDLLYAATPAPGATPGCAIIPFVYSPGTYPELGPGGYAYLWADNVWGGSDLVKVDLDTGEVLPTAVHVVVGGGYGGSAFAPSTHAAPGIPALDARSLLALTLLIGLAGVLTLRRSLPTRPQMDDLARQ